VDSSDPKPPASQPPAVPKSKDPNRETEDGQVSRRMIDPPLAFNRGAAWPLLGACLLLALAPIFIDINRHDASDDWEIETVATSLETWQRRGTEMGPVGFSFEQLVLYLNEEKQFRPPPASMWAQQIVFSILGPSTEDGADTVLLYGRLLSGFMALVVLASVFWAGYSIGEARTALFATLICLANPVFLYHAKLASPPMQHAAWAMFSIAAALWALRPLKPTPSVERQFIGWLLCGLSFGAALLTAGLIAVGTVAAPILLILLMCPHRRSHLMGLLAALLIALLITMPWIIYAHEDDPQVFATWFGGLVPSNRTTLAGMGGEFMTRSAILLAALLPWGIWLIGAVVQPFSTSSKGTRVRMFLGLSWFGLVTFILLTAPGAGHLGDLMLALPVFAVLIGQLFNHYSTRAAAGRFVRFWTVLRWPHLVGLLAFSIAAPLVAANYGVWIYRDWMPSPAWQVIGWILAIALIVLSARWSIRHHPGLAVVSWSLWMVVLISFSSVPLAHQDIETIAWRNCAAKIASFAGNEPVFWLEEDTARSKSKAVDQAEDEQGPNSKLLLYSTRTMPTIKPAQIEKALKQHGRFYILARTAPSPSTGICTQVRTFNQVKLGLWRFESKAQAQIYRSLPNSSVSPKTDEM